MHSPEYKIEQTLKQIYESALHLPVFTTWNDDTLTLPCLSIVSEESLQQQAGNGPIGNWIVKIVISLYSNVHDTTETQHRSNERLFRNVMNQSDIKEQINTLANLLGNDFKILWIEDTDFNRIMEDDIRASNQVFEMLIKPTVET
jgi:hypothetical protein